MNGMIEYESKVLSYSFFNFCILADSSERRGFFVGKEKSISQHHSIVVNQPLLPSRSSVKRLLKAKLRKRMMKR